VNEHISVLARRCEACGTNAWTIPARDFSGRPCVALSLHTTPDGTLCPRGAFALDEAAPTAERQRAWCLWAMRDILWNAGELAVNVMLLRGVLFGEPPAAALGVAAACNTFGSSLAELAGEGTVHRHAAAQRVTDTCRALATCTDITWDDIDPDGKLRAKLEITARVGEMMAAEDEVRGQA